VEFVFTCRLRWRRIVSSLTGMTGGLPERQEQFTKSSVTKTLDYIGDGLKTGLHLMGAQFTIADIQMVYLLELAKYAGLTDGRTVSDDYLDHLRARPALAKTLDIGGPMTLPKR
jgi:glutathione S-transferase